MERSNTRRKVIDTLSNSTLSASEFSVTCWESLSIKDRDFLLGEILDCQAGCMRRAAANKEDVKINFIGRLVIKPNRKKAVRIKKEELAKIGHNSMLTLNDEERDIVLSNTSKRIAKAILEDKMESRNKDNGLQIKLSFNKRS